MEPPNPESSPIDARAGAGADAWVAAWEPRLVELCTRIRRATTRALHSQAAGETTDLAEPLHHGAGDWSFGLDVPTEEVAALWHDEVARHAPLSLMTEDRGWVHKGPDPRAPGKRAVELADFDHGGPRIALDPVDGTRNLMADLRPAWTIVSCAGPGADAPRLADLELGLVSELPTTRAGRRRALRARRAGPCSFTLFDVARECVIDERELHADQDDRVDRGYFPFFHYMADLRPAIARVEAEFFARLAEHEGAVVAHCYDDQYISSGGQLVLLALGTYRMIADVRNAVARAAGGTTLTSKPYDLAGAVLVAQRAGCVVRALDGTALDFPLDTETPVDFVGFANRGTAARLGPHFEAALQAMR